MEQERREVFYDWDLGVEAYRLSGVVQRFPNHFHGYYVVGFIEGGARRLWCRNLEYDLTPGDLILFHPGDNHFCAPLDGLPLDYRALNIAPEVMARAVREITGRSEVLRFSENVLRHSGLAAPLGALWNAIAAGAPRLEKEEAFFLLLEQLLSEHTAPAEAPPAPPNAQIEALCAYMREHWAENVSLDELLTMTSFGKSYLLRAFTRQVGVSPYRYLQNIRLDRAKKLLERGVLPIEAAAEAGFADQSHFTNFFKTFIGLTPGQYQRIFTDGPEEEHHD